MVKTIEWKDNKVLMLDQSRLPHEVVYVECTDYHMIAEGIKKLWIRGAPAIGIAAAMGIALGAQEIKANNFDEFVEGLQPIFDTMLGTRPTAVNIHWAVVRVKRYLQENNRESIDTLKQMLIDESDRILREDIAVNRAIGEWGAEFVKDVIPY